MNTVQVGAVLLGVVETDICVALFTKPLSPGVSNDPIATNWNMIAATISDDENSMSVFGCSIDCGVDQEVVRINDRIIGSAEGPTQSGDENLPFL